MLYSLVLFIFVIVCLLLIGIILLQTSQTGGMGSIGGGNSYLEGALGGQGADSLLLKTTTIFAVIFMCSAMFLNYLNNPKGSSNVTVESSIEYSDVDEPADVQIQTQTELEGPKQSDNLEENNSKNELEKTQVPLEQSEE